MVKIRLAKSLIKIYQSPEIKTDIHSYFSILVVTNE